MIRGEKRKAVSFNLDNEREREIFELVSKTNFSRLVKDLLSREITAQRNAQIATQRVATQQKTPPLSAGRS